MERRSSLLDVADRARQVLALALYSVGRAVGLSRSRECLGERGEQLQLILRLVSRAVEHRVDELELVLAEKYHRLAELVRVMGQAVHVQQAGHHHAVVLGLEECVDIGANLRALCAHRLAKLLKGDAHGKTRFEHAARLHHLEAAHLGRHVDVVEEVGRALLVGVHAANVLAAC